MLDDLLDGLQDGGVDETSKTFRCARRLHHPMKRAQQVLEDSRARDGHLSRTLLVLLDVKVHLVL